MKSNILLEKFSSALGDLDPRLPKSRGGCFDIGMAGGCGALCCVFIDGECEEPQEITKQEIIETHGEEDAESIFANYDCFKE